VAVFHQLGRRYRKIEEQIDPKSCDGIEEVGSRWRIETETARGAALVVDRGDHVSGFVDTRRQLESATVQDRHDLIELVVRPGDDEIEIVRDPARSKNDQGHASNEHRCESEVAQRLRHGTDVCEVVG
jgi:hypothetical protein